MRTTNLNNYVNLLNEVYAKGSITNEMCRNHNVSCQSIGSLKKLKYADDKGKRTLANGWVNGRYRKKVHY